MRRFIDADALYMCLVKMNDFGELTAKKAIRVVKNAPTVNAEPVRHGRWILDDVQDEEENANDNFRYRCSCCGYSDLHAKNQTVPYCWHCGARMDQK